MGVDYSRQAAGYDRARADDRVDREYWLRGLLEVGSIQAGERVLDLGAGTGRFTRLLAPTNRVTALDPSREMLHQARDKGSFPCVQGDGGRLPFRPGAFDVTLVVMVLHHLRDIAAAFGEIARVSRRVVVATSDMTTRRLGILEEAFPSLLPIDRERFPPIEEIEARMTSAGFHTIRREARPYRRTLTADEQLDRVRRKYLSTFDLLPAGEYDRGLRFLERELRARAGEPFDVTADFTFLAGTR